MDTTDQKLAEAARDGPESYYTAVLAATKTIHSRLKSAEQTSAVIVGSDTARLKELLTASLVLNDCTSVVFNEMRKANIQYIEPHEYSEMFGCDTIRFNVSQEQIHEHGIDPKTPMLRPCFMFSVSNAQRPLMNAVAPFIEDGSIVFQPTRGILCKKAEPNAWHVLGVEAKLSLDLWEPNSEDVSIRPTPLEIQGAGASGPALFEVTLPFLKGVPLRSLHAMLNDDRDLVMAFRSAIRSAVREASKSHLTVT